jgi:hypothetical protein
MDIKSQTRGDEVVKNNIARNVVLQKGESVQKNFRNLKAIGTYCEMMLTTRRLIVYTFGPDVERGRRIRRRKMDEIDLRSIHRFEYYLDYHRVNALVRIFGLLFFLAGAAVAYMNYTHGLDAYVAIPGTYWYYVFGGAALFVVIGIVMMFKNKKQLVLKIKSGLDDKLSLRFTADKTNEDALRFIAGKIHVD